MFIIYNTEMVSGHVHVYTCMLYIIFIFELNIFLQAQAEFTAQSVIIKFSKMFFIDQLQNQ